MIFSIKQHSLIDFTTWQVIYNPIKLIKMPKSIGKYKNLTGAVTYVYIYVNIYRLVYILPTV